MKLEYNNLSYERLMTFLNARKIEYSVNNGYIIRYYSNRIIRYPLICFLRQIIHSFNVKIIYSNDCYYLYDDYDINVFQKTINSISNIRNMIIVITPKK